MKTTTAFRSALGVCIGLLLAADSGYGSVVTPFIAADTSDGDRFAEAVAIDGDTMVIGSGSHDHGGGSSNGGAYVFARSTPGGSDWTEVTEVLAGDSAAGWIFGRSVGVSGDTIVVGAPGATAGAISDAGAAYVFQRDHGGADTWGQVVKLVATSPSSGDEYGYGVAIDGDTIVVGAFCRSDVTGCAGAAWVYDRDQGGADTWGQVGELRAADGAAGDWFGATLDISGDRVVVGAWWDDPSGSAYVFERDNGGVGAWGEKSKLVSTDAQALAKFGFRVAIDGIFIVVGAPYEDNPGNESGAAYVFSRIITWVQQDKLTPADVEASDHFGSAVAICGTAIAVGAPGDRNRDNLSSGSAYLFTPYEGTSDWHETTRLMDSPANNFEYFGAALAVSSDTMLIGAYSDSLGSISGGVAHRLLLPIFANGFESGDTSVWSVVMP